jgi:hypothetical protein
MLFVPYYIVTEFAPGIIFGVVMHKYGEVVNGNGQSLINGGAADDQAAD